MQKNYPNSTNRNVQDVDTADDDYAAAILLDRIEDAAKGRQLQQQPLSIQEVTRLRQHGALN